MLFHACPAGENCVIRSSVINLADSGSSLAVSVVLVALIDGI